MSRRKRVGYQGILIEPIAVHDPRAARRDAGPGPYVLDARERAYRQAKAVADVAERVEALFDHYGISHGNWKTLALALAFDHVPGFGTRAEKRRRTVEATWYLGRLFRFINAKREAWARPVSIAAVCANLHKDAQFQKDFPELRGAKKGRLQNLYAMASARQGEDGFDDPHPSPMYLRLAKLTEADLSESVTPKGLSPIS